MILKLAVEGYEGAGPGLGIGRTEGNAHWLRPSNLSTPGFNVLMRDPGCMIQHYFSANKAANDQGLCESVRAVGEFPAQACS